MSANKIQEKAIDAVKIYKEIEAVKDEMKVIKELTLHVLNLLNDFISKKELLENIKEVSKGAEKPETKKSNPNIMVYFKSVLWKEHIDMLYDIVPEDTIASFIEEKKQANKKITDVSLCGMVYKELFSSSPEIMKRLKSLRSRIEDEKKESEDYIE
jgi:hypothetical protein